MKQGILPSSRVTGNSSQDSGHLTRSPTNSSTSSDTPTVLASPARSEHPLSRSEGPRNAPERRERPPPISARSLRMPARALAEGRGVGAAGRGDGGGESWCGRGRRGERKQAISRRRRLSSVRSSLTPRKPRTAMVRSSIVREAERERERRSGFVLLEYLHINPHTNLKIIQLTYLRFNVL